MKRQFFICGFTGWCLEIFWTGLHSLIKGDLTMMGKTSLLMFPIYGCASFIGPVYKKISHVPVFFRGCLYTGGFFLAEYTSGSVLRLFHMCPWDYSKAPLNYKGLIRFDYVPVWFLAGLLFEKIVTKSS